MRHAPLRPWQAASFLAAASFLLTVTPARAAWPTDPTLNRPVSASPTRPSGPPLAAPDSCGGIITVWVDAVDTVGAPAFIYVQRMDAYGQARWALNGVPVSPPFTSFSTFSGFDIASDGAGGAYVAWSARVTAVGGKDIFVQHVLAAGLVDPGWPTAGLPVCSAGGDQTFPTMFSNRQYRNIVADGAGGAVVAWADSRGNLEVAPDIYAQRVSSTGATWWTADGVPVVAAPGNQSSFVITPDGSGGIFAAFVTGPGGSNDIAAQRLDGPTGTRQWALAGQPVCTAPGNQLDPAVASAGGRLLVAWEDDRGASFGDIYAQSLALTGAPLWSANGAPVCVTSHNKAYPRIVDDGVGGAVVGWRDHDPLGIVVDDHHAQRLAPSGNPIWTLNGLPLCAAAPGNQDGMEATSDQRDGAVFTWRDGRSGTSTDLYAQRVSDAGIMLWGANGVAVTTAPNQQAYAAVVSDGAGGAVIAWQDQRGVDDDIYAQQVGATGSLGVRAPSRNCAPDLCGFAYTDFGDAPENVPAYPSGALGHFPTCTADSPAGTQETSCGAAPSTPPGPTGYVKHVATSSDATYFGLGCGPSSAQRLAVDTELDGVVHVAGTPPAVVPSEVSTCSPAVAIMAYENAFGGLWFGADEAAGDVNDAGLAAPPSLGTCAQASVPFKAWSCAPAGQTVTLNILVDWNQDGDWNDVVACGSPGSGGPCAPEWAVKNASIVLQPGCNSLASPLFRVGPNTGDTWMRITLTAGPVSDDFPWAGSATATVSGGAFAGGETEDYPLTIVTSTAVGQPAVPDQVLLAAVSPNPTRSGAEVRYVLPRAADVRLAVYDVAGRLVSVLDSGLRGMGEHVSRWNGRDASGAGASAGLYFVKLHAEGRDLARTVLRLR